MYKENNVAFKGNKDGLSIYLNREADYENLREQLIKKLESTRRFFSGAKIISIQGKNLSEKEKDEIQEIIHSRFGMVMIEKDTPPIQEVKEEGAIKIFDGIEEGNTKFIRATIRSGQKIKFEGNIVIIGDVNPGAEIIAEGNIMVMGALRGLAHAGSTGNEKAFVVAYSLQPTQLRIGEVIARSPDNEKTTPWGPELALVKNKVVVVEPYLPNK